MQGKLENKYLVFAACTVGGGKRELMLISTKAAGVVRSKRLKRYLVVRIRQSLLIDCMLEMREKRSGIDPRFLMWCVHGLWESQRRKRFWTWKVMSALGTG